MKNFLRIFTLIAGASVVLAQSKIAPDLPVSTGTTSAPNTPGTPTYFDVIVQYKTAPTQSELIALGPMSSNRKQFTHVNAVSTRLNTTQIQTIVLDPNVKYVSPNRVTKGSLDITTATVNANVAWGLGYTGTGVGVAVIDSGVYAHDDLRTAAGTLPRIVYRQSFVTRPRCVRINMATARTVRALWAATNGFDKDPVLRAPLKGVAPRT